MKKLLIASIMSAALLTSTAMASEPLVGGWAVTEDPAVTEEAKTAFEKATERLLGVNYEPVALLATQLVSGTNYCLLCQSTVVSPDAVPGYVLMYVYADLQGEAEVLEIKDLEIGVSPVGTDVEVETEDLN